LATYKQEPHTMNNTTARRFAYEAANLHAEGRHAEALEYYRAAVAAGYKNPAEEEQERQDRANLEAAATLAIIAAAIAAALWLRFSIF
jgi:hypothetical protein